MQRAYKERMYLSVDPGVRITTRQLAKCEENSGLASENTNSLANLVKVFFSSH
jgi:hypothetical protein